MPAIRCRPLSRAFGGAAVAVAGDMTEVPCGARMPAVADGVDTAPACLPCQETGEHLAGGVGHVGAGICAQDAGTHGAPVGAAEMGASDIVSSTSAFIEAPLWVYEIVIADVGPAIRVYMAVPDAEYDRGPVARRIRPGGMVYDEVCHGGKCVAGVIGLRTVPSSPGDHGGLVAGAATGGGDFLRGRGRRRGAGPRVEEVELDAFHQSALPELVAQHLQAVKARAGRQKGQLGAGLPSGL